MRVREGDVLVCTGAECELEFTVSRVCEEGACGGETECEINATCHGEALQLRKSEQAEQQQARR